MSTNIIVAKVKPDNLNRMGREGEGGGGREEDMQRRHEGDVCRQT